MTPGSVLVDGYATAVGDGLGDDGKLVLAPGEGVIEPIMRVLVGEAPGVDDGVGGTEVSDGVGLTEYEGIGSTGAEIVGLWKYTSEIVVRPREFLAIIRAMRGESWGTGIET